MNASLANPRIKRRHLLRLFWFLVPLTAILLQKYAWAVTYQNLTNTKATTVNNRYWVTTASGSNKLNLSDVTDPTKTGTVYLSGDYEVQIKLNGRWVSLGKLNFKGGDASTSLSRTQAADISGCRVVIP